MQKTSLALIATAAILAATSLANAQSATPIEGNPESCQIHDSHRQTPRPSDSVRLGSDLT
jgi:hypothetical protein